jgi:dTDP-4-dehydrorhamnose reductase/SAM-dependent methyltransferase
MMIDQPVDVEAVFTRVHGGYGQDLLYQAFDLTKSIYMDDRFELLDYFKPEVVVNLAGENRVDVVEDNPYEAYPVNVTGVKRLVDWCNTNDAHLIHVSSQIVLDPVNEYGKQKVLAEKIVQKQCSKWTIVRPTFVLGIRPFPGVGRENPAERILAGKETHSVADRYFSVSFAWDVAEFLWQVVLTIPWGNERFFNVGNPVRLSRSDVAIRLGAFPTAVTHSLYMAPRPLDTTYQESSYKTSLEEGVERLKVEYRQREEDSYEYRAKEIAAFLKRPLAECVAKLETGFSTLHGEVAEDFRQAAPESPRELISWYKKTEAYIWELTAYHCHPGFNYTGMCKGIVDRIKAEGLDHVLCLGDGTGDLSLAFQKSEIIAVYNDLARSRTAKFAEARFVMRVDNPYSIWTRESTSDFGPPIPAPGQPGLNYGAVVSADFLEHVPNVEKWVQAIYNNLAPGGLFFAQNAFGIGSGPSGSIPMHLSVNDRFEKDWDPLLKEVGFVQESSNWYRKPL